MNDEENIDNTRKSSSQCKFCNKRFTNSNILNTHEKRHTAEKLFKCVVCGNAFVKNCELDRHLKIHSGQKDHECTICGKLFYTSFPLFHLEWSSSLYKYSLINLMKL